ncbi:MAG: heterodisulfide reductase-related iron-sulfur binding cluster, partial [Bdellovibrionota bacterium]|nr:heterodisulfide reductase-related iron-sulfur binding cluster [Bdellovibrionota bacterium]
QNNEPQIGRDTLDVFEKNKVNIACVEGLACCGMPSWEHGDLETLRKNAKINLDKLTPYVEKGAKIIGINPTCTMMLRNEYPGLVAKEDREQAKKCAEAVMETSEFLWSIRKEERFNTEFKSTPGNSVAYHSPCHLRAQAVGFKGRDLLRKIPGVTPKSVMECCGHDGTFAMKKETFEASIKVGKKSFEGMKEAESEVWSTECPLAALQFSQHAGVKPLHPMSILAKAYRENGFQTKIKKDDDK